MNELKTILLKKHGIREEDMKDYPPKEGFNQIVYVDTPKLTVEKMREIAGQIVRQHGNDVVDHECTKEQNRIRVVFSN